MTEVAPLFHVSDGISFSPQEAPENETVLAYARFDPLPGRHPVLAVRQGDEFLAVPPGCLGAPLDVVAFRLLIWGTGEERMQS